MVVEGQKLSSTAAFWDFLVGYRTGLGTPRCFCGHGSAVLSAPPTVHIQAFPFNSSTELHTIWMAHLLHPSTAIIVGVLVAQIRITSFNRDAPDTSEFRFSVIWYWQKNQTISVCVQRWIHYESLLYYVRHHTCWHNPWADSGRRSWIYTYKCRSVWSWSQIMFVQRCSVRIKIHLKSRWLHLFFFRAPSWAVTPRSCSLLRYSVTLSSKSCQGEACPMSKRPLFHIHVFERPRTKVGRVAARAAACYSKQDQQSGLMPSIEFPEKVDLCFPHILYLPLVSSLSIEVHRVSRKSRNLGCLRTFVRQKQAWKWIFWCFLEQNMRFTLLIGKFDWCSVKLWFSKNHSMA